jgi:Protein kinase domain
VSEQDRDSLVMEYVDGRTLDEMIGGKALPVNETLRIAIQMADAFVAAHAVGVIHRNIKPRNIMVTKDARGQAVVKILDFGFAKMHQSTGPDDENASMTTAGTIAGTVAYMQAEAKPLGRSERSRHLSLCPIYPIFDTSARLRALSFTSGRFSSVACGREFFLIRIRAFCLAVLCRVSGSRWHSGARIDSHNHGGTPS